MCSCAIIKYWTKTKSGNCRWVSNKKLYYYFLTWTSKVSLSLSPSLTHSPVVPLGPCFGSNVDPMSTCKMICFRPGHTHTPHRTPHPRSWIISGHAHAHTPSKPQPILRRPAESFLSRSPVTLTFFNQASFVFLNQSTPPLTSLPPEVASSASSSCTCLFNVGGAQRRRPPWGCSRRQLCFSRLRGR